MVTAAKELYGQPLNPSWYLSRTEDKKIDILYRSYKGNVTLARSLGQAGTAYAYTNLLGLRSLQGNENKRSKKKLAKIQLTYIATSSTKGA